MSSVQPDSKRKRVSTGDASRHVSEDAEATGEDARADSEAPSTSYSDVVNRMQTLSDGEKIEFLLGKYCSVENMIRDLQTASSGQSEVRKTVELLATKFACLEERANMAELRVIDLEARSRRQNLVFFGIPEPPREDEYQITQTMYNFFGAQLGMSHQQLDSVHFQRVHRLGRPQSQRRGPRGRGPPKPRPIIICFRDCPVRQWVLNRSTYLRGTGYSIAEDFPMEIRDARSDLWDEFKVARRNNLSPKLIYPAKLLVGNEVVKDKFPDWGRWSKSSRQQNSRQPPRSGTSIEVSMEELIHSPPFRPRSQNTSAGTNHTVSAQPAPLDSSVHLPPRTSMQVPPPVSVQGPPPATILVPPPPTIQVPPPATNQVPHTATSQVPHTSTSQVQPQATAHVPTYEMNTTATRSDLAFQSGLHDANAHLSHATHLHRHVYPAHPTSLTAHQNAVVPQSYGVRGHQSLSHIAQPSHSAHPMVYPHQRDFTGFDSNVYNAQHNYEHRGNLFSIPEGTISTALNVLNHD